MAIILGDSATQSDLQEAIYVQDDAGLSPDTGLPKLGPIQIVRTTDLVVSTTAILPAARTNTASKGVTWIKGEGARKTVLACGTTFGFIGLIGYGIGASNEVVNRLILEDVTIDGRYSGVDTGGVFAQDTNAALVALPHPYTSAYATRMPNGTWHEFNRVRLYRPCGYGVQGAGAIRYRHCEFDACGQPDLASGGTHMDVLGSGEKSIADVQYSTYHRSSGNYADFVAGTASSSTVSNWCRIIFMYNESFDHQIGGIYAAGFGSEIRFNKLRNRVAGSGVGYDGATHMSNRGLNTVEDNLLVNLTANQSGLDPVLGDIERRNRTLVV